MWGRRDVELEWSRVCGEGGMMLVLNWNGVGCAGKDWNGVGCAGKEG